MFAWDGLGGWLTDQHQRLGLTPDHFLTAMPVPLLWLALHPAGTTTRPGGQVNRSALLARNNHALAARGLAPQAPPWFAPHIPRVARD